jgi:TolA-binding protein
MHRLTHFIGSFVMISFLALGCLAQNQDQQPEPQATQPAPQDAQTPSVQPAQDPDTANQIQQLRAEIDQLQQQVSRLTTAVEELQADRVESVKPSAAVRGKGKPTIAPKKVPSIAPTALPASPEPDERASTTVLVFQDGHKTEARNYAIVGQTLWIYTEQDSKKVPLAELDVNATKSANSERGIVFQVPNTK